jgi:hypothetical protein
LRVILPSGTEWDVLTQAEHDYTVDKIQRYLTDNHFTNVVDLLEIDKLITFELLTHRWSLWLSRGQDYYGEDINFKQVADLMNDYVTQCRMLKKQLGLDKVTRDRTAGDDSVPAFWDDLKRRALEFAVFRSEQCNKAIEGMMRMKAMLQFYDNCTEMERKENRCEQKDLVEVLREVIIAFDQIDENFRRQRQKFWIRRQ